MLSALKRLWEKIPALKGHLNPDSDFPGLRLAGPRTGGAGFHPRNGMQRVAFLIDV
jgi:hypothetical protein